MMQTDHVPELAHVSPLTQVPYFPMRVLNIPRTPMPVTCVWHYTHQIREKHVFGGIDAHCALRKPPTRKKFTIVQV